MHVRVRISKDNKDRDKVPTFDKEYQPKLEVKPLLCVCKVTVELKDNQSQTKIWQAREEKDISPSFYVGEKKNWGGMQWTSRKSRKILGSRRRGTGDTKKNNA